MTAEVAWTLEALKEHYDALFLAHENMDQLRAVTAKQAIDAALASAREAVAKAEIATEKRFDGVNEFRSALGDQTNTLLPRTEFAVQHRALTEQIAQLERRVTLTEGRTSGLNAGWGYLVGAIGALGGLVALIITFRT